VVAEKSVELAEKGRETIGVNAYGFVCPPYPIRRCSERSSGQCGAMNNLLVHPLTFVS
jgi:hypothetical protein